MAEPEALLSMFQRAPIADTFGMELSFDGERAIVDLPAQERTNHVLGQVHGGIFALMIDTAAWFTVALSYPTWVATVEYTTRLLEPVEGQAMRSVGSLVRAGKRIATATAEVRRADGELVAVGAGTFSVTGVPLV